MTDNRSTRDAPTCACDDGSPLAAVACFCPEPGPVLDMPEPACAHGLEAHGCRDCALDSELAMEMAAEFSARYANELSGHSIAVDTAVGSAYWTCTCGQKGITPTPQMARAAGEQHLVSLMREAAYPIGTFKIEKEGPLRLTAEEWEARWPNED
jgi:hypothetical protein